MAITKTYIGMDFDSWKAFLDDSGMFSSVTKVDSGGVVTLTCNDENGNSVLTISKTAVATVAFKAFTTGGHEVTPASYNLSAGSDTNYGYKCANGIMIGMKSSNSELFSVLITRNNSGALTFVLPNLTASRTSFYCVTYEDTYPVHSYVIGNNSSNQTQIVSFVTNAGLDTLSYTPDAFFMPFSQYYTLGYGRLTLGNVDYLTDGYWAIKEN